MDYIKITSLSLLIFLSACGENKSKEELLKEKEKQLIALTKEVEALRLDVGGKKAEDEARTKTVATTTIATTLFNHGIDVLAKVDGDENVKIGAEMGGNVTRVLVKVGDKVTRGQLLAETDNAALIQALEEVKLQRNFANTLFEKQERLWKQNIGSEVQYLSAKNNVDALDSRIATLNQQISMSRIKSPINGTIDVVDVKPGQMAAPGMPIISIVNKSKLKIKADLAEAYINNVKKGNLVTVNVPDAALNFETRVAYSGQQINPLNRTFNVEMPIDSKHYNLLAPNMLAKVSIMDYENNAAIVLPTTTILKDSQGPYVLVLVNEKGKNIAKKMPVEVGLTYKGKIEITKGLKAGDLVITTGQAGVTDGEQVKIQK